MKDSMPPEPPVPPQISGPPHGGGYGGPGHHHQQHMPPHSMPAPPPPPSINQHHLHHQASRDMSDHGHDSYDQHHDNYEDEGGMANMDLEEPEESSYHGNHRPMPDVYHTARRHPNSPQWDFFPILYLYIQLLNFACKRLLNKPYENEVTLTGQNPPLNCC